MLNNVPISRNGDCVTSSYSHLTRRAPLCVIITACHQDHKAISVSERQRIEKSGGRVEDGRVNGMLEVSRSFGDAAIRPYVDVL